MSVPKIVIVGGGAGGLELATRLGHVLGRKRRAEIHLVDSNETHVWKPLLHEVAAGSLDSNLDEVTYIAHARNHHFKFHLGRLQGLDRRRQQIELEAIYDDNNQLLLPKRHVTYDYLVLALGSVSNDFGTPGVKDHCTFLDSREQADNFRMRLRNAFLKRSADLADKRPLRITIIGGGATGVELSAELYQSAEEFQRYDIDKKAEAHLQVNLLEAGESILPALPDRIANAVRNELRDLGVHVREHTMVTEITQDKVICKDGVELETDLCVWAAGIKAPDFLSQLDGLETNPRNQIKVRKTLQSVTDPHIFALGDCASCPMGDDQFVPPRAQAAHQQASHLVKSFKRILKGESLQEYRYRDHGSLVSLAHYTAVGSLMGNLSGKNIMVEGRLARAVYISLYRLHQIALHGYVKTFLVMMVDGLNKMLRPRLKLH